MTAPVSPHARASAVALALIALVMIAVLVSAGVPGGAPAAAREPPTTVTASSALAVPSVPSVPSAFSRAVPSPVSASDARAPLARVSWLEGAPAAALAADGTPTGLWIPPLGSLEVTGPYSAPPHRYGSGHRGIDLAATAGMAVVAPASGTVSFAGAVVDRPVVSVRVDERTVYSLEPVSSGLAAGDPVAAGAVLGEVAGGGHCLQECVHLGVRVGGEYVNPLRYLRGRPVLLPW